MKDLKHIKRFNESEENLNSGTLDKSSSISDVSDSEFFILKLTKEEAKLLKQSLSRTMAKGDALTFSMKLEDELYNFYK
jgi:hypothetical protein